MTASTITHVTLVCRLVAPELPAASPWALKEFLLKRSQLWAKAHWFSTAGLQAAIITPWGHLILETVPFADIPAVLHAPSTGAARSFKPTKDFSLFLSLPLLLI